MNVVVTGASSGIGFELVKALIEGDKVTKIIGIARRAEKLEDLSAFAIWAGGRTEFIPIAHDVRTVPFSLIADVADHVDVLVNNAGMLLNLPFAEISEEQFMDVFAVNVLAPARLTRILIPLMGGPSASHVVNIGSMGGFQGSTKFAGLSAYSSSKAALACLTECLAEELKDRNIKVNCLAFGAVQTDMLAKAFPHFQAPVNAEQMAAWVHDFALTGHLFFNGKVLPVSSSTP